MMGRALLLALVLGLGAAPLPADAASELLLPLPARFGVERAITYATDGAPLGDARFAIERTGTDRVQLSATTRIEHGASNESSALFERVVRAGEPALRLLRQQTQSFDAHGHSLGVMEIDHRLGVARCHGAPAADEDAAAAPVREIALPERDRVANVALPLLFRPLTRDNAHDDEVAFQVVLCRALGSGPRVVAMQASVAEGHRRGGAFEIRYRPDLGPLSFLARGLVPRLSVWLDAQGNHVGHIIPLYSAGPTVLVVREGETPLSIRAIDDKTALHRPAR